MRNLKHFNFTFKKEVGWMLFFGLLPLLIMLIVIIVALVSRLI